MKNGRLEISNTRMVAFVDDICLLEEVPKGMKPGSVCDIFRGSS
jgi:hypothetical protein